MGATEKKEDLVRSYRGRRDAQCRQHVIAEDIRMSSLETLLRQDLEKHVQLNRERIGTCGVLREELRTDCENRGHARTSHTQEETIPWTLARSRTERIAGTARVRSSVGTVESASTTRRTVGSAGTMEHERWDRVFSATRVGIPRQLRPGQPRMELESPIAPALEVDLGVAPGL